MAVVEAASLPAQVPSAAAVVVVVAAERGPVAAVAAELIGRTSFQPAEPACTAVAVDVDVEVTVAVSSSALLYGLEVWVPSWVLFWPVFWPVCLLPQQPDSGVRFLALRERQPC